MTSGRFLAVLTAAALLLSACGGNWHRYPWYEIHSPDRGRVAIVNIEGGGGIGGDTTLIRVRSAGEDNAELVYRIHACPILHVFWVAEDHLEIQLTPKIHPCTYRQGEVFPVDGIQVSVTTPRSTDWRDIRQTLGSAEGS